MGIENATKVFDWDKAANIIKDKIKIYDGAWNCSAGLEHEEWTEDDIMIDGEPYLKSKAYLASDYGAFWATPILILSYGKIIECWAYSKDKPEWNTRTVWPKSALDILKGE